MQFGKISLEDLKLYLSFIPIFEKEQEEARQLLLSHSDIFFSEDCKKPSWCHLYELQAKEHFATVVVAIGAADICKEISIAPNQIQAIPTATAAFFEEFDKLEFSAEDKEYLRKVNASILGLSSSVIFSFRSLQIFGLYLNDLIALVRQGGKAGDKALMQAIKIDPTVLGCPSVVQRLSRASIEKDTAFFNLIKKAINGSFSRREHRTYKVMHTVLNVLYESGAANLSPDDLYTLFLKEMNLVKREDGKGDIKNALRQFAYQFIKQKSVSENR